MSDTVKLLSSYLTCVVLVIGGALLLTFIWLQPGVEGKEGMMALLGGFIGSALTFLTTGNASISGVRTFQSGLNTPTPPQDGTDT